MTLEPIGPVANGHLHNLARQKARDLTMRANGIEEAGMPELARETRLVAQMLLTALDELDAERDARRQIQQRCDTQQEILGKAVYNACSP